MFTMLVVAPLMIMALLSILSSFTAYLNTKNSLSSSPFECGMDTKLTARTPFSARFFLLAVLFLVFDIETALLLPSPSIDMMSSSILTGVFLFILILIGGLIHEWREGSLNWAS